jgi:hypothetical protein
MEDLDVKHEIVEFGLSLRDILERRKSEIVDADPSEPAL